MQTNLLFVIILIKALRHKSPVLHLEISNKRAHCNCHSTAMLSHGQTLIKLYLFCGG